MLSDIIPFFIMGILGFVKIPIFIDYLGQGYYGFTQIYNQIFNYLNLAEAGFGTSIVFALYSPIADRNRDKINRLLSGAKIIFRRIGIIILTTGFILSFFIDYLIKNNPMSPLYTQVAFILFLLTGIGNYFAYAPRFLLQADQNKYMTNLVTNIMRIVQIVVEIVLLILGIDLIGIFIWYFINMILTNIIINYFAYKSYPWMDLKQESDMSTVDNTKHVFMQKIATIIASNTDNIVLSAFVGVDVVAIYASYNYIAQFIISITNKIINSTQESFGNFFASKEKKEGLSTFWEMNSFLFYMASIVFTVTYLSINNLIRLWVGSKMLVSQFTVLLFCMV
jgi:O-antigen/teichoic acid export membrane protein